MRIAIMGSGGMGGYYGGLLAQRGHDVTFIARGKHLDAIRSNGLQVKSVFGDFQIKPAQATDEPGEVGPVDLVLVCTKTYDTDEAAPEILPMVAPETTILSLQNGIDATDRIGAVAGRDHMLAGTTWISSAVEEPGVIKQVSEFRRVVAGEPSGGISSRARSVVGTFGETGITAEASDNILGVLWQKFIFIAAASGLGSLTRMPIGAYRAVPETRRMIVALMREVEAVAHARKVSLALDSVDKALEFMDKAGPNIRASMQLDVEAGRRSEIESIIGIIGREGRRLGVPTPMTDMIYGALLPVDLKARGATA
jgi:2-dehydropantoate 2-reductase